MSPRQANPGRDRHRVEHHRALLKGIEAFALVSDRTFPRHAHDHFGIGVLHYGAHRSWSGIGPVEAVAGDVITVNPGEMHDGAPVQGRPRSWRMVYLDPGLVAQVLQDDLNHVPEFARPALRDPVLAGRFVPEDINRRAAVPPRNRTYAETAKPRPDPFRPCSGDDPGRGSRCSCRDDGKYVASPSQDLGHISCTLFDVGALEAAARW